MKIWKNERNYREDIIEIGRRLYQRNLTTATDGNLSIRVNDNRFLVTRSGCCKGELTDRDILIADPQGKSDSGIVTSEIKMHMAVYQNRPNLNAVIHAHPPFVVACSLSGITLRSDILPEILMTLGEIAYVPFAAPSSGENAPIIAELIKKSTAFVLDRHGALTADKTLEDAFYAMERLEFAAKVIFHAHLQGNIKSMTPDEITRVKASATSYSIYLS